MKNILILVGAFPPHISASSNIAYNLVEEFQKQNYNVTVLTRKNNESLSEYEEKNNVKIYRINDWNQIIHNKCIKNIEKNIIFKFILLLKRIVFFIPKVFRMQNYSKHYSKKICRKMDLIIKKHNINIIIPISSPHEEIFSAINYKNKHNGIQVYPYQLDKFADGDRLYATNFLKKVKYKNNLKEEIRVLKKCNKMFMLPPIFSHYANNDVFNKYMNKIEKTEHPLLKNYKKECFEKSNTIDILYAGAFYKELRNPEYLFKLLDSELIKNSDIKLNLYSFGDCQDLVNSYAIKLKDIINSYGKIDHDDLIKKMQEANILLSIGNNSKDELPSKIFEYLSFCKPIVHLYYSDDDQYLKYLPNYKYSLCLKMDENIIKDNIKLFYNFCKSNKNVDINYKEVESVFGKCTPKYTVKQIIRNFKGG